MDYHGPYDTPAFNGDIYSIVFVETSINWCILFTDSAKITITSILDKWLYDVKGMTGEDTIMITLRMDGDPSTTKTAKVAAWAKKKLVCILRQRHHLAEKHSNGVLNMQTFYTSSQPVVKMQYHTTICL